MALSYRDILMEWIRIFIQLMKVVGLLNINHTHLLMSDKSSQDLWGLLNYTFIHEGQMCKAKVPWIYLIMRIKPLEFLLSNNISPLL